MLLYVQYKDFKFDYVNTRTFDRLLVGKRLLQFYRPSKKGWVNVYRDPIRGIGGDYSGPDRRQDHKALP